MERLCDIFGNFLYGTKGIDIFILRYELLLNQRKKVYYTRMHAFVIRVPCILQLKNDINLLGAI